MVVREALERRITLPRWHPAGEKGELDVFSARRKQLQKHRGGEKENRVESSEADGDIQQIEWTIDHTFSTAGFTVVSCSFCLTISGPKDKRAGGYSRNYSVTSPITYCSSVHAVSALYKLYLGLNGLPSRPRPTLLTPLDPWRGTAQSS